MRELLLVDTGSLESFIFYDYIKRFKVKMDSATRNVFMASLSLISPVKGLCTVKICGGACVVMVIIIGNGHNDTSSNPG